MRFYLVRSAGGSYQVIDWRLEQCENVESCTYRYGILEVLFAAENLASKAKYPTGPPAQAFESEALRACELLHKRDARFGRIPQSRQRRPLPATA